MTSKLRGADLLLRAITAAGVNRLFTLSGNQIMPVFDAALDTGVELLHTRHEAAAVHMADAWGRLTGDPGVALVTAGPGFANALSAMYVALMAESPVVLLSGHAPREQLGRGAFQEMQQAEMAGHVAKASWTVTDANQIGHDFARAMRLARGGRPGPVHLSLPFDLLQATVDERTADALSPDEFYSPISLLDISTAESVLAALSEASRPLVLAGPSAMRGRAGELLDELADRTFLPCIGMESPRGVDDPSLGAFREVLAQADRVVLVGKRLDFTLRLGQPPFFADHCRFMQLDPEAATLEQTERVLCDESWLQLADLADPVPALERLLTLAGQTDWPRTEWYDEVQAAIAYRPPQWNSLASSPQGPLHPVELCRAVQPFLDHPEAIFISDGGEFGQWAQACLSAPRRIINGPSGSIGSVIPFALAARCVSPDGPIVATLGDGTMGFHLAEFDTAVRHNLPFVAVVGNDACWNAEYQIQLRNYGPERTVGCELLPTRYDQAVATLGGHGENVARPEELEPALQRAVASGKPACVNVSLERQAAPTIRRSN